MASDKINIHPSADVSLKAHIGSGTRVWHLVQIREGVAIGENCIKPKGNAWYCSAHDWTFQPQEDKNDPHS